MLRAIACVLFACFYSFGHAGREASAQSARAAPAAVQEVHQLSVSGVGSAKNPWRGWEIRVNQFPEGTRFRFRSGFFLMQDSIRAKNDWVLSGDGKTSIISLAGGANVNMVMNHDENQPVWRVRIEKLSLIGNRLGQTKMRHVIALRAARQTAYEQLFLREPSGDCIIHSRDMSGNIPMNWIVRDVQCEDFGRNGISVSDSEGFTIEDVFLSRSDIRADPGDGIDLEVSGTDAIIRNGLLRAVTARSNAGNGITVIGSSSGINASHIAIEDCVLEGNARHGIHLYYSRFIRVRGCEVRRNGRDGVRITGDARLNQLASLKLHDNNGWGVQETDEEASHFPQRNFIVASEARGNQQGSYRLRGESSAVLCSDSSHEDCDEVSAFQAADW